MSPIIEYIADNTLTTVCGRHTFWVGAFHPVFGWPCVPPEVAGADRHLHVAGFLYAYWRTPGYHLRFRKPSCGYMGCVVVECQQPYDVPKVE